MIFAVAIVLGSFLLFLIEPIAAKQVLPLLGGSAAVWTACLVFFQTALLVGYLCAHLLAMRLPLRRQPVVFLGLLGAALVQLAITYGHTWQGSAAHPILSVFALLGAMIGIPFLALSATGPLLQSWFAYGMTRELVSPFHLFALSNLASLFALLAYPAVIEPRLSLRSQLAWWSAGFAVFVLACELIRRQGQDAFTTRLPLENSQPHEARPAVTRCALWFLLAACGSLLLAAVTNYISRNLAAVPLLWTIPLSVYLLSFVAAFNGRVLWPRWFALLLLALALGATWYVMRGFSDLELRFAAIPIFCAILFACCAFCHGEIYRLRPSARHTTAFYLWISAGGAAGAFFVGVLAPVIFSGSYELFCGLTFVSALAVAVSWDDGIVWAVCWAGITGLLAAWLVSEARVERLNAILQARSFYGTIRVTESAPLPDGTTVRTLYNGTIDHGGQLYGSREPRTANGYYAPSSGVGLAIDLCCTGPRRVGIVGLGTGTIAAYGRRGDVFRFYEIDPLVEQVARRYFTYLRESEADVEVALGDARVSLAQEPSQQFDVLAIDAFSGDAIPVHLLTSQAVELYRRHLKPDGILAVHVTNRYLNLAPVVKQEADHAGLESALIIASADAFEDVNRSDWVLVSANSGFFARDEVAMRKERIDVPANIRLWDDDYNSLLPIVRWQVREPR